MDVKQVTSSSGSFSFVFLTIMSPNIFLFFFQRPHDSPVVVSLACGSLSGIASSTGEIISAILGYLFCSFLFAMGLTVWL